jgi:hypothetical protein
MNRATWLQDRRIQRFRDVLSRWKRKELSAMEAGELLGCSERQFRRYRTRTGAGCRSAILCSTRRSCGRRCNRGRR